MTDEQQRDLLAGPSGDDETPEPGRRRGRGLLGRFRRQRDEAPDDVDASPFALEPEVDLEPARRVEEPEATDVAEQSEPEADDERPTLPVPPATPAPAAGPWVTDSSAAGPEPEPELEPQPEIDRSSGSRSSGGWGARDSSAPLASGSEPTLTAVEAPEEVEDPQELDDDDAYEGDEDEQVAEPSFAAVALDADRGLDDAAEAAPQPAYEAEPRVVRRRAGLSPHLVVLTALATLVMMSFLLIEPTPRWLLLLGAAAVVIGLDGTLRQSWREPFASGAETAPYLFVPALYMLAVPVVIEHNIPGELVVVVGLIASAGFGLLAWAETASVRALAPEYDLGRVVVTAATYVAGFAIFSLTYVFEVELHTAVLAVALAATMLSVEVLREGEIDPGETLGFALVTGIIMAEARWLMYYVPLDTYLAGLTLLLGFYLVTGLLHSHITRAFSWTLSAEYGGIAAAGLTLVVLARAAGLA